MIDLHSHILPGVDDGAADLAASMEMARLAVADGTAIIACTPHFYPGVYDNDAGQILSAIESLQAAFDEADIPLRLVSGGDVHIAPDLVGKIKRREVLTLNESRYILVEPPHNVLPPRIENIFFDLLSAGYQPILTHPERMQWVEHKYDLVTRLWRSGVWMQVTAAAITGGFGGRAKQWARRMLKDGMVEIVASDAHGVEARPPGLTAAFNDLCNLVGAEEAQNLVHRRPELILRDGRPEEVPNAGVGQADPNEIDRPSSLWRRMFRA